MTEDNYSIDGNTLYTFMTYKDTVLPINSESMRHLIDEVAYLREELAAFTRREAEVRSLGNVWRQKAQQFGILRSLSAKYRADTLLVCANELEDALREK